MSASSNRIPKKFLSNDGTNVLTFLPIVMITGLAIWLIVAWMFYILLGDSNG